MAEPFIFGIPLIARAAARNWPLVQALLELTLTSVHRQTAQDFHIVIAGHDRPDLPLDDARTTDWPAEAVSADNLDSGRKKHAINELVLARGGGRLSRRRRHRRDLRRPVRPAPRTDPRDLSFVLFAPLRVGAGTATLPSPAAGGGLGSAVTFPTLTALPTCHLVGANDEETLW